MKFSKAPPPINTALSMPAPEILERLRVLADLLIPGDDDFPAPSVTGAPELTLQRLLDRIGEPGVERLIDLLAAPSVSALQNLETHQTDLFAELRLATYFSYYQQPEVIAALQALGHDYQAAPQPFGYALEPFDARPGHDLPAVPRGFYLASDAIERIDISSLPWFSEPPQ